MSAHRVIEALREDDGAALAAAAPYDADIAPAIHSAMAELDVRGRLMATWVLARAPGAARVGVLLDMTGDPIERVGVAAARVLLGLAPAAMPSAEMLVYAIPVRLKPSVRSLLYRALGMKGDPSVLEKLRGIFDQERDDHALGDAHLAAVRLGGRPERVALFERVEAAAPHDVARAFDDLVYVADRSLARSLEPWFDDERVAKVIGNHFRQTPIRVMDYAAVAVSRLGLAFDHGAAKAPLTVSRAPIPDGVVAAARAAVLAERAHAPAPAPLLRLAATPATTGMEPVTMPLVLPQVSPPSTPFALRDAIPAPRSASPTLQGVPFQPSSGPGAAAPLAAVAPPRQRPRIPTGTLDLESALAAEKVAEATPFPARSSSSPPPARGPQLSVEQYAWICALLGHRPDQRLAAWRRFGVADEAVWNQVNAAWQSWLAADRARLAHFHELVAEYRRGGASL